MSKYLSWYNSLISSRRYLDRNLLLEYKERHHILPRSLGGSEDPANLVYLTPREHYLAHYLLVKHFKFIGDKKKYNLMLYAFSAMALLPDKRKLTSKQYDIIRSYLSDRGFTLKHRENLKKSGEGRIFSDLHIKNLRESLSGYVICLYLLRGFGWTNGYKVSRGDFDSLISKHPLFVGTRFSYGYEVIDRNGKSLFIFNQHLADHWSEAQGIKSNRLRVISNTGVYHPRKFSDRHLDGFEFKLIDRSFLSIDFIKSILSWIYNPYQMDLLSDYDCDKCRMNVYGYKPSEVMD